MELYKDQYSFYSLYPNLIFGLIMEDENCFFKICKSIFQNIKYTNNINKLHLKYTRTIHSTYKQYTYSIQSTYFQYTFNI